jgi:hypothetical protein
MGGLVERSVTLVWCSCLTWATVKTTVCVSVWRRSKSAGGREQRRAGRSRVNRGRTRPTAQRRGKELDSGTTAAAVGAASAAVDAPAAAAAAATAAAARSRSDRRHCAQVGRDMDVPIGLLLPQLGQAAVLKNQ